MAFLNRGTFNDHHEQCAGLKDAVVSSGRNMRMKESPGRPGRSEPEEHKKWRRIRENGINPDSQQQSRYVKEAELVYQKVK